MTFARRRLSFKIQLVKGSPQDVETTNFNGTNADTVQLDGYRAQVTIDKAGAVSMAEAHIRIYGLASDLMNKLTILNQDLYQARGNRITVTAGDDDSGMSVCFQGTIAEAWADMNGSPDTSFYMRGTEGLFEAMKPVPPVSFNGSVDCAVVAAGIAHQMGYVFENSGVSVIVRDPYLKGTAIEQMRSLARQGNFNSVLDNGTLAIWPSGGVRGGSMPLISKDTGMVGYPAWTQSGIQVTTLYNPSIVFGAPIKIESLILPTTVGSWVPYSIGHDLEAEMPAGKWYTHMECGDGAFPLPVG